MSSRLMREIKNLKSSNDLIVDIKDENIKQFEVMFFGPPDSAYHHGIFLFQVRIPDDYPFKVPLVSFMTGGIIGARMHPNLHREGKVCLSILNTWGNHEWSSLLSIEKVMITIRALLDNNPVAHEPAYNNYKADNPVSINYRLNATYHSLRSISAMYKLYSNHPVFGPAIKKYISDNHNNIMASFHLFQEHLKNGYNNSKTFHHHENMSIEHLKDSLVFVFSDLKS